MTVWPTQLQSEMSTTKVVGDNGEEYHLTHSPVVFTFLRVLVMLYGIWTSITLMLIFQFNMDK